MDTMVIINAIDIFRLAGTDFVEHRERRCLQLVLGKTAAVLTHRGG